MRGSAILQCWGSLEKKGPQPSFLIYSWIASPD